MDEEYNQSRRLRAEVAIAAAAAASLCEEDLVRIRIESVRRETLDSVAEAALSDLCSDPSTLRSLTHRASCVSPRAGARFPLPETEEGLVTEEWRDAVCEAVLLEVAC